MKLIILLVLTQPNVVVITNASAAHLEGVGDVAGVARAKAEKILITVYNKMVTAILNRDDAFYPYWREQIGSALGLYQLWLSSPMLMLSAPH